MNNCTYLSKYTNQIIIQNISQRKLLPNENNNSKENYNNNKRRSTNFNKRRTTINKDNKKVNKNKNDNKIFFNEYLSTDPNEMDYDDVIEKDKRTCCQYFIEKKKTNN